MKDWCGEYEGGGLAVVGSMKEGCGEYEGLVWGV